MAWAETVAWGGGIVCVLLIVHYLLQIAATYYQLLLGLLYYNTTTTRATLRLGLLYTAHYTLLAVCCYILQHIW